MEQVITLTDKEAQLCLEYAALHGQSLGEALKTALLDKIKEDEYDLKCYNEAMDQFMKNPVTYFHEEVAKLLGLEAALISLTDISAAFFCYYLLLNLFYCH